MGACASIPKAMRREADDEKAPLPEQARELPEEVKADEGDKVESKKDEKDKVVADDQISNKVEEPEKKEEQKTTAEPEELPKAAPAAAAGEAGHTADGATEVVKEEK